MNPVENNSSTEEINSLINYERIWYRVLRYWYFLVVTMLITIAIAFMYNRYATKIYPMAASIIIKESEEAGQTAELLYNNPLINSYRNFLNEPYIIRSFPLLQKVVDSLGFSVVVYGEGNIKTTEQYSQLPIYFSGNKQNNNYLKASFNLRLINSKEFKLSRISENDRADVPLQTEFLGTFNDTLIIDGFPILVKASKFTEEDAGINYIVSFVDGFEVAKQYANRLNVDWAEEGASVIDLSLNATIPQKEIDFLGTLIRFYTLQDEEKKKEVAHNSKQFIDEQLQTISDTLLLIEKQLELFKDNNTIVSLGNQANQIILKVNELEDSRTTYLVKDRYYNYLINYLKDTENLNQIVLPAAVGVNDAVLNTLISQMVELQMQLKLLNSNTSYENPMNRVIKEQIIDSRAAILESINNLKSTDAIIVNQLNRQVGLLDQQLAVLPNAERKLITIQRAYKLGENQYVFLTQKGSEAAISEASTLSDVIVVNEPHMNGGLISPNSKMNYLIALFLGLGIPIGFFVLKELFNTKVQSKVDVEMASTIPIIGVIGHNNDIDRMVVSNKPKSSLAEAFRSLRSNLNYFIKKEKFTLMLTSSISGEGKSFTALNLANIFALSGKKTVIVGADMRKPRIYQELGLSNNLGLSNFLSGQAPIIKVIQETEISHLSVISSGPVPPNPGELILRSEFRELMNYLQKNYDIVLIDTPPMGIVADALAVATYVDHTLFIARQNYTPIEAIIGIDQQVKQGKLSNISIVFNDIYKFGPGYGYGYGYGYSYGYGYGYNYGYGQKKKNGGGYYEE